MSERIKTPYRFTISEKKIIANNFKKHTDWDNPIFNNLKSKIKTQLRKKQKNKCCYCKRELGYDKKDVEIEHIIAKSEYPKFTFEPRNLALSCPGCNNSKNRSRVLSKSITYYPKTKKPFKIIHAHYDIYKENIIIHNNCVYEGISPKGCRTIEYCELFRLGLVEKKGKKALISKSKSGLELDLIMNADPNDLPMLIQLLGKRLEQLSK